MNARLSRTVRRVAAPVTDSPVEATARLFAVLSHPARLGVLALLVRDGTKSAGALGMALGVEASSLSHQLRALKDARLVVAERRGREIVYRLHDQHVASIVRDALAHVGEHSPG